MQRASGKVMTYQITKVCTRLHTPNRYIKCELHNADSLERSLIESNIMKVLDGLRAERISRDTTPPTLSSHHAHTDEG